MRRHDEIRCTSHAGAMIGADDEFPDRLSGSILHRHALRRGNGPQVVVLFIGQAQSHGHIGMVSV